MTEFHDDLLDALRAADPVAGTTLPGPADPAARQLLDRVVSAPGSAEPAPFVPLPGGPRQAVAGARRRGRILLASAAAVVVLALGALLVLPGGTAPALAALQQAAAETASVDSGRVTTTLSFGHEGQSGTGSGQGTVEVTFAGDDVAASVVEASSTEAPELAEAAGVEVRLVDGVIYLQEGGRWLSAPADGLLAATVTQYLDPRAVLDMVNDVTTASEVGPTTLDGVAVTHYRGTVDMASASAAAMLRRLDPSATDVKVEGTAEVELYVDGDGLLRQLDVTGDIADPAGSDRATYDVRVTFNDLGAPLDITAPEGAVAFDQALQGN